MFTQTSSSFVQICAALHKWCINHDTSITNLGDWCLTGVGLQEINPSIPYNNVTRVSDYMLTHFLLFSQVGPMRLPIHKLQQLSLCYWRCGSEVACDSYRALSFVLSVPTIASFSMADCSSMLSLHAVSNMLSQANSMCLSSAC